ncbi:MAG: YbjQ family protein [Bacteroidota bacterium]
MASPIIVTTTPHVEGARITGYLGVVSAYVVAGTNLFADMAASFSDVFGGRSQSYHKQLASINKEVLDQLADAGLDRGAHAVVGVRVDFDEVSGGGKSMFMVTASGTAVTLDTPADQPNRPSRIDADALGVQMRLAEIAANTSSLSRRDLAFAAKHRSPAALPQINAELAQSRRRLDKDNPGPIIKYVLALPEEAAKEAVYGWLARPVLSAGELGRIVVEQGRLFDPGRIRPLLMSEDEEVRLNGLTAAGAAKRSYGAGDINPMRRVAELVEQQFPVTVVNEQRTVGMFSKEEVVVRLCGACGASFHEEDVRCSTCRRDVYGVPSSYVSPPVVINRLLNRADALTRVLTHS